MKPYIDAIKALLAGLGYAVLYVDIPSPAPTAPYVLLWSTSGIRPTEVSVAGSADLTDTIGVTMVGANADAVLIAQARVRGVLDGARPAVAGRLVWLDLYDSQPVTVDRDVTPHVPYGVDLYRLISTPA